MLDLDGVFQCYSLEPPKRADKPCCIPAGIYKAKKYISPSKRYEVILLLDVPGFDFVEWHIGNFPEDTIACTVVGQRRGVDAVWNSKTAFHDLMSKVPDEFEVEYTEVAEWLET